MLMIPIDTGNKAIKTENFEFHFGITALESMPGENEEALMFQDKYYRLNHERNVYLPDKMLDDRYYLLTLFAIAKELEKLRQSRPFIPGELISMELVVGLPPLYYRSQYKKFRDYFYREGRLVHFAYMGRSYRLALDTIMKSLEEGVEKVFTSEQYQMYLQTMAKFHNYSFNNTLLIAMQRPDATLLAGYQTWQKKFHRHVKRGEKGIKIIAPVPVKEKRQVEKIDEETQEIVIGIDGQPETETVERILPRFRVTTVFDVSQTEGEPLPSLEVNELAGDVLIYEDFMKGLEEISPVPFLFQEIDSGAKGYYSNVEKLVAIQTGMSQAQTMKTAVHEMAHAILHDRDVMEENGITKDRMTIEVEAESVAYVVCNHFGLDTSDYSFNYVAGWSSGKEMSELRSSMDTIRLTSSQLIADITEKLLELQKTRELENDIKTEELAEESSFLSHTENSYAIYQYHQVDNEMGYQYMSLDFIEKMGMPVKGQDYQMMYQGVLEVQDTLEDLYIKFNIDRPEGFKGHSMSTSDVVILKRDGEMKAYYVNDIGFRELPEFVDQRAEVLQEKNSECVRKQDKSGKEQEEPEKIREDRTITETIQSNVSKKKNQQMQAGLHR